MKWLRSSLFKDNKDKFFFEEKLDINVENFDTTLKSVEEVVVSGTLTRNGQDKIVVDLKITGIYKIVSSRTLNILDVPFTIEETEEFIDKLSVFSDDIDINTMDMFIDINNFINELIVLNVPTSYYLDNEVVENSSGKDWNFISDEDYIEDERKDNPFSALSDMFKEK